MNYYSRKKPTLKRIIKSVCEFYSVAPRDIVSSTRAKNIVIARGVIVYLIREELKKSYPFIGNKINRDHTSVLYLYRKIKDDIEKYENLKREVENILTMVYGRRIKSSETEVKHIILPKIDADKKEPEVKEEMIMVKSTEDFPNQQLSRTQFVRQGRILKKYEHGWTLQEIAKECSLTRQRVKQIVDKGLLFMAREIVKKGVCLNLKEFLKEEKRKHLVAMKSRHGISKKKFCFAIKEKRWSKYYDFCRRCGKTTIPHHSHGYCRKCYPKTRIYKEIQTASRLRNIEKRKAYTHEYSKQRYRLKACGGNREKAIARSYGKCDICGLSRERNYENCKQDLRVMHINNKDDHSLDNLMVLCRRCFIKELQNRKR